MSVVGTVRRLARKSPRAVLQHAVRRWADRLEISSLDFPLLPEDIADSAALPLQRGTAPRRSPAGRPRLGWVVIPPGPGSGGHTTLFRMMEDARRAGFDNTLLLYDRWSGDLAGAIDTVRRAWPWLTCDIAAVSDDLSAFDGLIASSWPTAHVIARRRIAGQAAVYFVQDFEPYFYPRGSEYALAEDSYRLGLSLVALGDMVGGTLESELGVRAPRVPFGCDRDVYHLLDRGAPREGVVFYAKRGNDRRGYRLAVLALERFHRLHPDEPIHVYGDGVGELPFPVVAHGSLSPSGLNELYNSVVAGLALSFTNISLVAEEMLAAGAIPVVNDSPLARADLASPHARWAAATPAGLAAELSAAVTRTHRDAYASHVAAGVTTAPWSRTGEAFADLLHDELRTAERSGTVASGARA